MLVSLLQGTMWYHRKSAVLAFNVPTELDFVEGEMLSLVTNQRTAYLQTSPAFIFSCLLLQFTPFILPHSSTHNFLIA